MLHRQVAGATGLNCPNDGPEGLNCPVGDWELVGLYFSGGLG